MTAGIRPAMSREAFAAFTGVRAAVSEQDFEDVRVIRNAGRQWMHDTHEITPYEQLCFRASFPYPVWLYTIDGTTVAFGMVTPREGFGGRAYVTLAVSPEWRGRGIGRMIYGELRERWHDEVWAICRSNNLPSIRAARAAGFEIVDAGEQYTVLKAPRAPTA